MYHIGSVLVKEHINNQLEHLENVFFSISRSLNSLYRAPLKAFQNKYFPKYSGGACLDNVVFLHAVIDALHTHGCICTLILNPMSQMCSCLEMSSLVRVLQVLAPAGIEGGM